MSSPGIMPLPDAAAAAANQRLYASARAASADNIPRQLNIAHRSSSGAQPDHTLETYNIPRPLNVAHRGSSGTLPEHTLEAYRQAIADGADYIECDITLTRDLVPVCIHEVYLSITTDVANRTEFDYKKVNRSTPEGDYRDDWYAVDFDWEELKQLRKRQAYSFRDQTSNDLYLIPSFAQFLHLPAEANRTVGIYPELKDAEWLNSLDIMNGTRFEDIVLGLLSEHGYNNEVDPCYIQSFSGVTLEYLTTKTQMKLVMLIEEDATNADLDKWKSLGIDGIGVWTAAISEYWTPENKYKNWINGTSDLVDRAHSRQLEVHVWTIRNEDEFLAWDFHQNVHESIDHFLKLGVDGFFTDFPGTLTQYLDLLYSEQAPVGSGSLPYVWNGHFALQLLGCLTMALFVTFRN